MGPSVFWCLSIRDQRAWIQVTWAGEFAARAVLSRCLQEVCGMWAAKNCTFVHVGICSLWRKKPWIANWEEHYLSNFSGKELPRILLGEGDGTHSSTLAWKIPWTEEPGRLQSMGLLRVGHTWATSLSLFTFMHWRRKWQPTPVFLLGESQGRGSLVGCHQWGHTESDTTEAT